MENHTKKSWVWCFFMIEEFEEMKNQRQKGKKNGVKVKSILQKEVVQDAAN